MQLTGKNPGRSSTQTLRAQNVTVEAIDLKFEVLYVVLVILVLPTRLSYSDGNSDDNRQHH